MAKQNATYSFTEIFRWTVNASDFQNQKVCARYFSYVRWQRVKWRVRMVEDVRKDNVRVNHHLKFSVILTIVSPQYEF